MELKKSAAIGVFPDKNLFFLFEHTAALQGAF
jgi:hypothetical protein